MKYIWPIQIGVVSLVIIHLAWQHLGRYAFMYALVVLLLMPVMEISIQGKGGKTFAFIGLVIGAVFGLVVGYHVGPIISESIGDSISIQHNIRLDLVIWWFLFSSFFASFFSVIGGRLGRTRNLTEI